MKKTYTRPDGTTEVVEGSPEELADYERRIREEGVVPKKGRKLLKDQVRVALEESRVATEKTIEELRREMQKFIAERYPNWPIWIYQQPVPEPFRIYGTDHVSIPYVGDGTAAPFTPDDRIITCERDHGLGASSIQLQFPLQVSCNVANCLEC